MCASLIFLRQTQFMQSARNFGRTDESAAGPLQKGSYHTHIVRDKISASAHYPHIIRAFADPVEAIGSKLK
jgi:hypothetical protein